MSNRSTTTIGSRSLELRSILSHRSCSNRWARTESRFVRSSSGVFYLSRRDVVGPGKCRVITSRRRKRTVFRPGDEDRTKNGASGSDDWRMRFATGSDALVFGKVLLLTTCVYNSRADHRRADLSLVIRCFGINVYYLYEGLQMTSNISPSPRARAFNYTCKTTVNKCTLQKIQYNAASQGKCYKKISIKYCIIGTYR